MFRMAKIIMLGLLFSSVALADDDWGEHHHRHHGHHRHGHGHEYYPVERVYVPERVVEYVPVRERYYAPPPPPPVRYSYDQRSPQGLVGGMVGSAMGYEMGGGDPLAAGIGAAAGSWFGNGMGR